MFKVPYPDYEEFEEGEIAARRNKPKRKRKVEKEEVEEEEGVKKLLRWKVNRRWEKEVPKVMTKVMTLRPSPQDWGFEMEGSCKSYFRCGACDVPAPEGPLNVQVIPPGGAPVVKNATAESAIGGRALTTADVGASRGISSDLIAF